MQEMCCARISARRFQAYFAAMRYYFFDDSSPISFHFDMISRLRALVARCILAQRCHGRGDDVIAIRSLSPAYARHRWRAGRHFAYFHAAAQMIRANTTRAEHNTHCTRSLRAYRHFGDTSATAKINAGDGFIIDMADDDWDIPAIAAAINAIRATSRKSQAAPITRRLSRRPPPA